MNIFICKTCGHIAFNNSPDKCPVCGSPRKDFSQNNNIFTESQAKSPEAEVKHVPSVQVNKACGLIPETGCTDILIRIGKTLHPMEEKHFIQFIDFYRDFKFIVRIHLTPNGVQPAACVHLKESTGSISVVENCNIHGYWKTDVKL